MAVYTMGDVSTKGNYPIDEMLEIKMNIGVNRHGFLTFGGLVSEEVARKYANRSADNEVVSVYLRGELEFCGYPHGITVEYQNDHHYLRVTLITSSQLMDIEPRDRFYQDGQRTYEGILTEAYEDSGIGSLIAIRGKEAIRRPILQFRETDALFTLRMAGRNGTILIPNVTLAEPQLMLGVPNRKVIDESNDVVYSVSRNATEYRQKSGMKGQFGGKYGSYYVEYSQQYTLFEQLHYQNFLCYKMRSDNRYKLGDSVRVAGKVLTVMEKKFAYAQGEIVEHYVLGHEQDFAVPFHYNKRIAGLELEGEVQKRFAQQMEMLLDIDAGRKEYGKTWFFYAPTTNNAMYSMPLTNEKVKLQWQSEADDDALIVRPERQNSPSMPHPGLRHFLDENGNHLMMVPGKVEHVNPVGSMKWLESFGFDIKTGKKVIIHADEDVNIKSNVKTTIFSPERITAFKHKVESSIDMTGSEIHIKAVKNVNEISRVNEFKRATLPEITEATSISTEKASKIAAAIPQVSNPNN